MPSTRFQTTAAPASVTPAPADHSQAVWRAWRPADSSSRPAASMRRPPSVPVTRNGVLRVQAGPVVASIARPAENVSSRRPGTRAPAGDTVTPRRPSRSSAPSHAAHHAVRAKPTRARATHSIPSGPNAPAHSHCLRKATAGTICSDARLTDESIHRGRRTQVRAAAVQMQSTPDRDRNLAAADRLTRAAAAAGAELVVLPEKWPALGNPDDTPSFAQPFDGPAMQWARGVAAELGIDLVAGSFTEAADERGRNTSVHVGPDGEVRASYRKIHMFDVEVGGRTYKESAHEAPGEEIVVSETADGTGLGLTVCYDLRFPELYRILAVNGARILSVPAAFTLATTREHWEVLLRARAIEDQCFVVAANQVGEHAPGIRSGGRSMIVDPWGVVLATAPDKETFVVADLDLERQAEIRRTLPSLANRRPEAYRWPAEVHA